MLLIKRTIFFGLFVLLAVSSLYGMTSGVVTKNSATMSSNVSVLSSTDLPNIVAEDEEQVGALTIFFILLLLLILILLVYGLIKAKFHYLPESIACVLLGWCCFNFHYEFSFFCIQGLLLCRCSSWTITESLAYW
jgi:hypothetical protein